MQNILANWKTSVAGVFVIGLGVLGLVGVHVPGFNDPGITIDVATGAGLIFAGDASKFASALTGK